MDASGTSSNLCPHVCEINIASIRRFQALKINAMEIIHRVMTERNAHEAARQTLGPLSLLATFSWYLKPLFSSATPLNTEDRKYFHAICGLEDNLIDPYISGQIVFTMANLWSQENECPSLNSAVHFSSQEIIRYFKATDQQVLANLVSGRDRSYRPSQSSKETTPGIEWLLLQAPLPSRPLRIHLHPKWPKKPVFTDLDKNLCGLTDDELVEAIFVAMARAVWHRIPSHRINNHDVPNLVGCDQKVVRETWGVEQFRKKATSLQWSFKKSLIVLPGNRSSDKAWDLTFNRLFGECSDAWEAGNPNQGIQKLGYFPKWKFLMEARAHIKPLQKAIYSLMKNKFNSLLAFPQMNKNGRWKTTGEGGNTSVNIMVNPVNTTLSAAVLTSAGYEVEVI
jgi:hypothetical protein